MINTGQIDRNLQVLGGVEKTWGLPSIPDGVKLDLASMDGVDHHTLGSFATGLANDVQDVTADQRQPLALATPALATPHYSVRDQFDRAWAGISGARVPENVDSDGVVQFKQRAVNLGYLDPTTPMDSTWDPELNKVRWQVMQDDAHKRNAGDKPGSVSTGGLSKFIGDWLSPSGLLKAATKLDVLPDFAQVSEQSKGFLGAASDFVNDPSLHHFKKLFTENPLDDLLIPVVNDALLLSGVGEVWAFARAGDLAFEGAELANASRGLLGTSKLAGLGSYLRSADYAADAERFKEASVLSKVAGRMGGYGQKVEDAMKTWREYDAVANTKKGVQAGMRLGLAEKLEEHIPGYKGTSLADVPGGRTIADYTNTIVTNPLVSTIGEVLFTPPNVLEAGSIGRTAKALNPLRFAKIPQDQQLSVAFLDGLKSHLEASAPEQLEKLQKNLGEMGPGKALAEHFFGGSTDEHLDDLGKSMTYVATAASLDAMAAAKADRFANRAKPDEWNRVWATFRNKYISQLRQWDGMGDEQLLAHHASWLAGDDELGAKSASSIFKKLTTQAADDPSVLERLRATVADHDQWARGFHAELLNNAAQPGVIENYLPQVLDTFGNWSEFATAQTAVKDAVEGGLLDDSKYLSAMSERNRRLVGVPAEAAAARGSASGIGLHHRLWQDADYVPWVTSGMYAPLARGLDSTAGAFTVAKADTVTKQEMLSFAQSIRGRQKLLKDMRIAEHRGLAPVFDALSTAATDAGHAGIHELDNLAASSILDGLEAANRGSSRERITRILGWMRHGQYGDLTTMRAGLEGDLAELDASPAWAERFGVANVAEGPNGIAPASLDDKVKTLVKKSRWTAAQVAVPDGLDLPENYKLVHGVQYLMPSDLLYTAPIKDLTEGQVRKATIGAWFSRQDNKAFSDQLARVQRLHLQERLVALHPDHLEGLDPHSLDSPDLDTVLGSLRGILNRQQEAALTVTEDAGKGRIAKAIATNDTPVSLDSLGRAYNRKLVLAEMQKIGYTRPVAEASWQALKDAQTGSFKRYGLATMEKWLGKNPYLTQALYSLGKSNAADGLLGKAKLLPRAAPALAGGLAGMEIGGQLGGNRTDAALGGLAGAVAGAAVTPAIGKAAVGAAQKLEHSDWLQWAYLGDQYAHYRDTLRFTLNPFFDVRRFVKSTLLAHTAELGADVRMSAIPSKASFVKEFGEEKYLHYASELRGAMKGVTDPAAVEETHQFFTQQGLLGYDPTAWMTHMYGRLREAGVDMDKAHDTVRKVYAYGTQGRSAAEQSMNYIFFPFSFEKKVATHLGKFLSNDLSRAVMIHDAMKTYEVLDQKFDLHTKLEHYLPLVDQLQQLNPLDHGLGPGELGGINAPLLKLFLPQVFSIHDKDQASRVQRYAQRLVPFYGEVQSLRDDAADQGHVMFSPSHLTKEADVTEGFDKARVLRKEWDAALKGQGRSWRSMLSDADLAPLKQAYDEQMAEIERKYPEYTHEKGQTAARIADNANEIKTRLNDPEWRKQPANQKLAQFTQLTDLLDEALHRSGMSFTEAPDDIPPEVYDAVHQDAVRMAREEPGFLPLYKRFFQHKYGPITKELH